MKLYQIGIEPGVLETNTFHLLLLRIAASTCVGCASPKNVATDKDRVAEVLPHFGPKHQASVFNSRSATSCATCLNGRTPALPLHGILSPARSSGTRSRVWSVPVQVGSLP